MVRTAWAISVALGLLFAGSGDAQEGRLQRVRDDINAPGPTASSGNDKGSSSSTSSNDSCDDGGLSGAVAVLIVLAPFYVPMALLNDGYEYRLAFAPHPYANQFHGYQIMAPEWANAYYSTNTDEVPRKSLAVRFSIEDGNDFNGINRFGGQLKLEHESRWGILTNWNYFHERMPGARYDMSDETLIGDTNLTFRFAQNEVASMYAGLGFRVLTDREQTDFGFNFTYGGDWFPGRPFVVSGSLDAGNLGSAGVIHVRSSVGAILGGCEVFAGYDFLRIGGTNLQGPMAGVRWWF
jgi:hypothetical protein